MNESPVLIIGGNGKTGSRVDQRLRARGIATRAVSRSSPTLFDSGKPEGWAAALHGVRQVYAAFQPDLAVDGASEAIAELGRQALAQRVEHIVLFPARAKTTVRGDAVLLQRVKFRSEFIYGAGAAALRSCAVSIGGGFQTGKMQ